MMLFTDETMGLMPVLWLLGGLQNVVICHGISPDLFISSRNLFIFVLVRLVVSVFSFL